MSCKLIAVLLVSLWATVATSATPEELTFFENEVRPILANHCYECHSARSKKLQANLRLDSLAGMLRGGDSGPVISPGHPEESPLISAVGYEDYEMPPRGKLDAQDIGTLAKWVSIGAPWPDEPEPEMGTKPAEFDWRQRKIEHWCWQPIVASAPPVVRNTDWPINPIDAFILKRLEETGLTPAKRADKRTLIRRLFFDLVGLPPTPESIQAFLDDSTPDAYEALVDELLDSLSFGEKWARHWLDLVRYGETLGHEFDYPLRHAYRYRDYVIRALNADVPYDLLVREHIAGDLLSPPRRHPAEGFNESIIGTGFWFLGEACHAPTDVRQDEADRIDNQIDVFSKAFLGVTVACARCHDHKFDPIPTKDYYALAGYIQSSRRQEAMLDPHGQIRQARAELERLSQQRSNAWRSHLGILHLNRDELRQALDGFLSADQETTAAARSRSTHPLHVLVKLHSVDTFVSERDQLLNQLQAESEAAKRRTQACDLFIDFAQHDFSDWYVTGQAFAARPTRCGDLQMIEGSETPFAAAGAVHSGRFGGRLQGVLRSPTFVLNHKRIHYKLNAKGARIRLIVDGYTMDEFNALLFRDVQKKDIDTQGQTKWITQSADLYHYVGHRVHIELLDRGDGFAALQQIRFSNDIDPVDGPHELNLAVLAAKPNSFDHLVQVYVNAMHQAVKSLIGGTCSNDQLAVVNWMVAHDLIKAPSEVTSLTEKMMTRNAATPRPVSVISLTDGDAEDEYVFIRGNHRNRGELAPRRLLVAIAGENQTADPQHSGRLQLARKVTDASNPLTARVAVNRLWHHLFGRGIVSTVDDFGKMGQPPSHPQLLDWLADDFMHKKKWSTKQAIKQIVMSQTYAMSAVSSADRQVIERVDPENVLLYRAPVRRMTAEAIRDSLLQLSGRLDPTMFGPSVPVYLSPFMEGRGRPGKSGPLDGNGRRSLYIEVRRNFLTPMMLTFDRPSPFSTMGKRSTSNVPAQSLALMNDPFVVAQASQWAQRIIDAEEDVDSRINLAFEMAFSRPPTVEQRNRCRRFLEMRTNTTQAWSDLCHMLINMKPFIFVQ